nr:hypothetical protein [Tanacetum cinerariifolium]
MCGSVRSILYVIMSPQSKRRGRGRNLGHGSKTTNISNYPLNAYPSKLDTIQLETAVSTIFQEYLLEFTSEYGISEDLHPEFPGPKERIVDFP